MRILFISPNRLRLGGAAAAPGIGLGGGLCAIRASQVAGSGFHVRRATLWGKCGPRLVTDFRPDIIGISVRNIDNQDSRHPESYVAEVKELVNPA